MPKRVDANQKQIVEALRKAGATVQSLASIGKGCPDVLASAHGVNYLLEVKSAGKGVTDSECDWIEKWEAPVAIVYSPYEALEFCGLLARRR